MEAVAGVTAGAGTGTGETRGGRGGLYALLPPPLLWMLVFYLAPLAFLLMHAFWSVDYLTIDRSLTLENVETFLTNGAYARILGRTILMAVAVTVTCAVIAFPVAFVYNMFLDRFVQGFTVGAVKG